MAAKLEENMVTIEEAKVIANETMVKYEFSKDTINFLSRQNDEFARKIRALERENSALQADVQLMKESSDFKDFFIEMTEKEMVAHAVKLRKLAKNHPAVSYF